MTSSPSWRTRARSGADSVSLHRFAVPSGWRILLADTGIPVGPLLAMARLPADLFQRADARLPPADYYRFWDALTALSGAPELPLRLLKKLSVEMFDPASFAALCSPDLLVALHRIQQFKPLIGPLRLHIASTPLDVCLQIDFSQAEAQPPSSLIAMELGYFVQIARLATRQHIVPLEVTSPVALHPESAHTRFFGVRVTAGSNLSLRFSAADAARPFITENRALWNVFEPALQERLTELTPDTSMTSRVRHLLLELVPSGLSSADAVASRLAISRRTLQRKLRLEGTSFSAILFGLREELARHYICHSDLPYGQISFLLGYDDPNSFFRAFNSWTGTTPDRLRQGL